jgi:hypothetical protein
MWLQLHTTTLDNTGTPIAPTAAAGYSTSLVYSAYLTPNFEFAELFNSSLLFVPGPVYAVVSTTESTYTAATGTDLADINLDVEEFEIEPSGLITVSDAGNNKKAIWTNAAFTGAQRLYDAVIVDLNQNAGAQLYLQLFAADTGTVVNGLVPIQQWTLAKAGAAGVNCSTNGMTILNFGDPEKGGLQVVQQGLAPLNSSETLYQGCTLAISTTASKLTLAAAGSCYFTVRHQ